MDRAPSTNLSARIAEQFARYGDLMQKMGGKLPDDTLFAYQRFIVEYMTTRIHSHAGNDYYPRGMCVLYEPGTGKSFIAAALAELYPEAYIIYFAPKSIHDTFIAECEQFAGLSQSQSTSSTERIFPVTSNAGNAVDHVRRTKTIIEAKRRERGWTSFPAILFVADEAHKFAETVSHQMTYVKYAGNGGNGDKKKNVGLFEVYRELMAARDIQLLLMTGTPITSDPFTAVPLFNLARGYMTNEFGDKFTAFPEDYLEFCRFFIDDARRDILNSRKFQERIYGICATYRVPTGEDQTYVPHILRQTIRKVIMRGWQDRYYRLCQLREEQYEADRSKKHRSFAEKRPHFIEAVLSKSGLYRTFTRLASNFVFPDRLQSRPTLRSDRDEDSEEDQEKWKTALVEQLTAADLSPETLPDLSCKFAKILETLTKEIVAGSAGDEHFPQAFYSNFVTGEGIEVFARCLEVRGYFDISADLISKISAEADENDAREQIIREILAPDSKYRGKLFAKFSSKEDARTLSLMKLISNDARNCDGELVKILMLSPASSQGITFKSVTCLHVCDHPWGKSAVDQLIKRFIRIDSHVHIPIERRGCAIYFYFAALHDHRDEGTDESIYKTSQTIDKLNRRFISLIDRSSIICEPATPARAPSGLVSRCFQCIPAMYKIFNENFLFHMSDKFNCIQPITLRKVRRIDYEGITYFVDLDTSLAYRYVPELADYIAVDTETSAKLAEMNSRN